MAKKKEQACEQEQEVKQEAEQEQTTAQEEPAPKEQEQEQQPPQPEQKDPLAECKEQLLRTLAEYDNYRKRTAKEKEALRKECIADAVEAFLPVLDNLHRAAESLAAQEGVDTQGVELVRKQFEEILTSLGVQEIPAEGKPFDPNLHNAVMHVEDDSLEENTVVEVFSKGYQIGDRVIRHCVVKVAN